MTETVFIGVGSNIDPETNVPAALDLLKNSFKVTGISRCFRTQPIDRSEQNEYVNCVWQVETEMPVEELNGLLHEIENQLGRIRTEDKYAARTIDLDILIYANEVLDEDIETREFLKAGLSDLDSRFRVPDESLETDEALYAVLRSHLSSVL